MSNNYSRRNNVNRRKQQHSQAKRVKNKTGIIIFRVLVAVLLIGGFGVAGALVGAYMGVIENAPKLGMITQEAEGPFSTIIYNAATGRETDRLDGGENREWATKEEIPQYLKDAFVAIEDERFYTHDGVDMKGLLRALYQNLVSPQKQGASTITMQLIKNKLGLKRNTWDTKLQEQYLAIEFEKKLTEQLGSKENAKAYILEQYMNAIGLGHGQVGVKAAARRYFDKEVSDLTLAECTAIAAITQNPTGYSPINFPEKHKKRQMVALDNMLEFGMITQAEYDMSVAEDIYSEISSVNQETLDAPSYHSYFNDAIIEQVITDLGKQYGYSRWEASNLIYTGGLSIYSTEDERIQKIVDDAFMNESLFPQTEFEIQVSYFLSVRNAITDKVTHYPEKTTTVQTYEEAEAFAEKTKDELLGQSDEIEGEALYAIPQPQAAMVIMDQATGQVKAIAGGRGAKVTNRGLNRATQSYRQPGSVFKILASFAPAIDMQLITPATVIDDVPFTITEWIPPYSPRNWYSSPPFRGLSTVRTAIKDSMNVATVKNMYNTGLDNCIQYLYNFGFTSLTSADHVYAAALGGIDKGISQVEVTAAYAAIANNGYYNRPVFYTQVLDHNGNVLLENIPEQRQILKQTSAYLLTDMMKDVITGGTGQKARFKEVRMPIAGKTGTTTATRDLTFVGYTPYYAAGIWMGYDMPKEMNYRTEGTHSALWSYVMEQVHQGFEYKEFSRPDGIVTASVCMDSGLLAGELCSHDPRGSRVRTEIFAAGTQPTKYCEVHQQYEICAESKKIANEYCPEAFRQSIVGIVRPIPYEGDPALVGDTQYEIPKAAQNGEICDIHNINNQYPEGTVFNFDEDGNITVTTPAPTTSPLPDSNDPGLDLPIMPGDGTGEHGLATPTPGPGQQSQQPPDTAAIDSEPVMPGQ